MEAIREMIGKNKDKGSKSKDNDDRSGTGPDTSSAYRSSDASGEPDVGTKSYSRGGDEWDDRQQNDPNTSTSYASRHGGPTHYSKGSSDDSPPSERTTTGRDKSSYSGMGGDDDDDDNDRHHSPKKHSHRGGNYSREATGTSIGDDETGDMGGGAHGSRGMHGSEYSFGGLAQTLPVVPGLFVNNVGSIPLPLAPEHAEKLIAKCAKSPFGHNMDTKMDESVRKSWQLEPDQVELTNPLWQIGMEKLTETIATRMGYKGVSLHCVLYKLLVYGEGGHFLKHQDTEKEDGMIATLVVQPPSTHEGGDLIVYRNGQVEHRHDFGKADATAAYFPHYAVHYSDAEHALEQVTKGYRLALVYSICLPESKYHLKRDQNMTMSDELANVINGMGPEDDSFALLLSHEYTKKSIGELGTDALKVEANDLELTKLFLTNCCPRLGYLADNTTLIPVMTKIARLFSWDDISDELLTVIGNRTESYSYRTCGVSTAEVLLLVASGLDDGIATQALIDAAIAERNYILRSREAVEVMCNAVRSGDKQIFDLVTSETQKVKPQDLGHYVEVFTRYITVYNKASQEYAVLKAIAAKRVEWLKEEIERLDKLDKTFSWRMPFAESDLVDFFQSPEQSLTVKGILTFGDAIQEFANLSDAKEYAAMILEDEEQLCSFTTEIGEDEGIFVTFTKTKTWFEDSQTNLARFQSELAHLSQIY
ncbi:hypothetical protein PInf_007759 [Phytophthora infestans]|nr:hypothetical protein PInf_007759 [Phytophthora infestans]